MSSCMYGIAKSGPHRGEMTRCRAHDPSTCPYHTDGSHRELTKEQAQRFNEGIIATGSSPLALSKSNGNGDGHTDALIATNGGDDVHTSFSAELRERFSRKGGFLQRKPMSSERTHRMRKAVASVIMLASIMGSGACGHPYYDYERLDGGNDITEEQSNPGTNQSTPGTSNGNTGNHDGGSKDWRDITGDDLVNGAKKGMDSLKDKANEFKESGKMDELKGKAGEAYGKAKDYVNSGDASDDLKSLIDSLSSYGVGGSMGDVNSGSGSHDVYANIGKEQALRELSSLRIEQGDESGYDRGQWRHWIATSQAPGGALLGRKSCFSVREQVLSRQGTDVRLTDDGCEVEASFNDPYTGTNGHSASDMQIDHSVPLGYAYAHGGRNWSAQRKQDYANDLTQGHLVAALGSENIAKSDKGPSQWLPDKDQCGYAKNFTHVLYRWGLSTSKSDHDAMDNIIQQCAS